MLKCTLPTILIYEGIMIGTITKEYLETNFVEFQTEGTKCICPDCGGRNLWETAEKNGIAHCWNCGTTYKIIDAEVKEQVIKVLNVEAIRKLYISAAQEYRSFVSKDIRKYLHDRGIDDKIIEQFAIGYCPNTVLDMYKDKIAIDAGLATAKNKPVLANRIVLPYIIDDLALSDMRGRTAINEDPKYKSLFGASESRGSIYPYNWKRAMEKGNKEKYIIITEGEFKSILADVHGFPCVALPGMISWKRAFNVPIDWRVIVIFDNSVRREDKFQIDKAIARVQSKLLRDIYVATLPLLGNNKQDIDSFLLHKSGGYNKFKSLVENALPYKEYKKLRAF